MNIGTILLSAEGNYIDDRKQLPYRVKWDKQWLKTLVELNTVSKAGYDMLPPSIKDVAKITHGEPTLAITVPELDALPDILYVVRSPRMTHNGKKFRLTNYEVIMKEQRFEIWSRK